MTTPVVTTPAITAAQSPVLVAGAGMGWMSRALCATPMLRDLAWISDPEHRTPGDHALLVKVCAECPVQDDCAAYADTNKVTCGFWCGTDLTETGDAHVPAGGVWVQDFLPGLEPLAGELSGLDLDAA
jgi:hypothetical protein